MVESPPPQIPMDAKVAIVTPFYGTSPLTLRANKLPDQETTNADRAMLATITAKLAGSPVVKVVGSGEPWDYAIQRGCLGDNDQLQSADAAGCRPVYYIAGAESAAPALNRFVPAGPNAGDGIVNAADKSLQTLGTGGSSQ